MKTNTYLGGKLSRLHKVTTTFFRKQGKQEQVVDPLLYH